MPAIRASADLRNNYSEISSYCHNTNQPVFITKNGHGDLAVMSIAQYDQLLEKVNLYSKLAEGLKDIQEGRTQSFDSAMKEIRKDLEL
ncbi:MAG: type II toxin-antitoxin system Phd/YefM family antitoxin [Treponema sp.]|nr:type II toxin-antitoxin system Phd/YefM family antitoxin [Treponema sp.]